MNVPSDLEKKIFSSTNARQGRQSIKLKAVGLIFGLRLRFRKSRKKSY
jgi:hypothetical protein